MVVDMETSSLLSWLPSDCNIEHLIDAITASMECDDDVSHSPNDILCLAINVLKNHSMIKRCLHTAPITKSDVRAVKYKEEGNALFMSNDINGAVMMYSNGLRIASSPSVMALLLANRSAANFALTGMNALKDTLLDINRSLMLKHTSTVIRTPSLYKIPLSLEGDRVISTAIEAKLLLRRGRCLIRCASNHEECNFISSKDAAQLAVDTFVVVIENEFFQNRRKEIQAYLDKALCLVSLATTANIESTLLSSHVDLITSTVSVRHDNIKGNYTIASSAIERGSNIMSDTPVCISVLARESRCDLCVGFLGNSSLPCLGCARVAYCSESCQTAALEGMHVFECGAPLLEISPGSLVELSLRALISVDGNFGSDGICKLKTHWDDMSIRDAILYALTTAFVGIALTTTGGNSRLAKRVGIESLFLDVHSRSLSRQLVQFLWMLTRMQTNVHAITCVGSTTSSCTVEERRVACALFPSAALVNHNCRPSAEVTYSFQQGQPPRIFLRALQSLQPDDEVSCSYGPDEQRMPLSADRRSVLSKQYFFTCFCIACTAEDALKDETRMKQLTKPPPDAFACVDYTCNGFIHSSCSDKCTICGSSIPLDMAKIDLQEADKLFHCEDNIESLQSCLKLRSKWLHHTHNFLLSRTHDALARAYSLNGNRTMAVQHCRLSTATVCRVFGERSIQATYERVKLCGCLCECFMETPTTALRLESRSEVKRTLTYMRELRLDTDVEAELRGMMALLT